MSVIHRFIGKKDKFDWENIPVERYNLPDSKGVSRRILIGEGDDAPYFVMRYFEVEPGGCTSLDKHPHDHGVFILKGKGRVLLKDREFEVKFGDVIYISPGDIHQFKNTGDTPFGFICVIPNKKLIQ